jgi:hypothetical protein
MALGNGAYERRRVAASGLVVVQHLCRTEGAVVDVVKADQTKQMAERGGLGQHLLMTCGRDNDSHYGEAIRGHGYRR